MKALSLVEKKFIFKNWIQSKESNQWIRHTKRAKEIQKFFQEKFNRLVCINTIIKHGLGFLDDEQAAKKKTGRSCHETRVLKKEKALQILEKKFRDDSTTICCRRARYFKDIFEKDL